MNQGSSVLGVVDGADDVPIIWWMDLGVRIAGMSRLCGAWVLDTTVRTRTLQELTVSRMTVAAAAGQRLLDQHQIAIGQVLDVGRPSLRSSPCVTSYRPPTSRPLRRERTACADSAPVAGPTEAVEHRDGERTCRGSPGVPGAGLGRTQPLLRWSQVQRRAAWPVIRARSWVRTRRRCWHCSMSGGDNLITHRTRLIDQLYELLRDLVPGGASTDSAQRARHRLSRGGDRQAQPRATHRRAHPSTHASKPGPHLLRHEDHRRQDPQRSHAALKRRWPTTAGGS